MPYFKSLLPIVIAVALTACSTTRAAVPVAAAPAAVVGAAPAAAAPTTAQAIAAAPTAAPPSPTLVPRVASGVTLDGIDLAGKTEAEAKVAIDARLAPLLTPINIAGGPMPATIDPNQLKFAIDGAGMLAAAMRAPAASTVPLSLTYDDAALRSAIAAIAASWGGSAPKVSVISGTDVLSRSFAIGGRGVAVDADLLTIGVDQVLRSRSAARTYDVAPLIARGGAIDKALLQQQLEAMAEQWKGVMGVVVYDADGDEIAAVNPRTVFSSASTIKVAIMLNAYISLKSFTPAQDKLLKRMIIDSDNIAANGLLAASVNGGGTEDAVVGANTMSDRLADLGLTRTYMYSPFEAGEYIRQKKLKIRRGPVKEGEAPYTESGRYLRAAPEDMAKLYLMIERCSGGSGVLLEKYPTLTAARCTEMVNRLYENGDKTRLMAGLPKGTKAAHKSGWIEDMQADNGIVRSPNGDYIVSIYIYRPLGKNGTPIPDRVMTAAIASVSRLVYTYFNPINN